MGSYEEEMAVSTFQANEVASFVFGIIAAFVVLTFILREKLPSLRFVYAGFFAILAANFFTVIEGVLWEKVFNLLEHLSYAVAALFFTVASWKFGSDRRPVETSELGSYSSD